MPGSNSTQGMPTIETPIVGQDGSSIDPTWFRLLLTLYNRTGAQLGNNSPYFNYPDNAGDHGQLLTSQGATTINSAWQTLTVPTKLSQLTNDSNFIDNASLTTALVPYSTSTQTVTLVNNSVLALASDFVPNVDLALGSAGIGTKFSRDDHFHPVDISRLAANAITGSNANPGWFMIPVINLKVAYGSTVLILNASSPPGGTIPYPIAFAQVFTFIASNGDGRVNNGNINGADGTFGLSSQNITVPGATPSTGVRVDWITIGR